MSQKSFHFYLHNYHPFRSVVFSTVVMVILLDFGSNLNKKNPIFYLRFSYLKSKPSDSVSFKFSDSMGAGNYCSHLAFPAISVCFSQLEAPVVYLFCSLPTYHFRKYDQQENIFLFKVFVLYSWLTSGVWQLSWLFFRWSALQNKICIHILPYSIKKYFFG